MNYLAHIFLSGSHPEIKLGNFFGDFVKGNQMNDFSTGIRTGILLHRKIDEYTDHHPVFRNTVQLLRPSFGRYAGIMADMYYDHLLAVSFDQYSTHSLKRFSCEFYMYAFLRYPVLPNRIKRFIFHFAGSDRLGKYASKEGLLDSLEIMHRRKSSAIQPTLAMQVLDATYAELERDFEEFFPELIQFAAYELSVLRS